MAKDKKSAATEDESQEEEESTTEEESEDDESAEDTDEEEESEEKSEDDSDDEESEDEDESESSDTDEELDLDAELAKEKEANDPDPKKAEEAFKGRKKEREKGTGKDKPLTQADLDAALAADRKERQRDEALTIAKGLASSDKEAELIVAKWANRTFPKSLTLREQMQEAYAITHSKRIIGQRDEAMRALKGKKGVKKDAASSHRDAAHSGSEPKLPPNEAASLRASGFTWNLKSRQFEKKLPNGRMLIRDNKTKQVRLLPKRA